MHSNLHASPDGSRTAAAISPGWQAHLKLGFEQRERGTVLTQRLHTGPLRVQKPLYPEGSDPCHAIIVHPPGGIAAGDQLYIDLHLHRAAQAVLCTPGATKWYRSQGVQSSQTLTLHAQADSVVEWLPQENIVFDSAQVVMKTRLELDSSARMLGWDITCLGRSAHSERFTQGQLAQRIDFYRAGKLVWSERGHLRGNDPLLQSPTGLQGHTTYGTMWLAGIAPGRDLLKALRKIEFTQGACAVTALPDVTLIRTLSSSCEAIRQHFIQLRQIIRPCWLQREAQPLRIWAT